MRSFFRNSSSIRVETVRESCPLGWGVGAQQEYADVPDRGDRAATWDWSTALPGTGLQRYLGSIPAPDGCLGAVVCLLQGLPCFEGLPQEAVLVGTPGGDYSSPALKPDHPSTYYPYRRAMGYARHVNSSTAARSSRQQLNSCSLVTSSDL